MKVSIVMKNEGRQSKSCKKGKRALYKVINQTTVKLTFLAMYFEDPMNES